MKIQMICWLMVLSGACQVAFAQTNVSLLSYESSCRFFDRTNQPGQLVQKVGIQVDDFAPTIPWSLTPSGPLSWAVTRNTSPHTSRVNVEWQGMFTSHGVSHFDDFSVTSNLPHIRPSGPGVVSTCYRPLAYNTHDPVVLIDFGLSQGGDDDHIYVEGDITEPVRAIRLEVYETAAGGDVVGELVQSVEYAMPDLTEPFMSLRNLNHEPLYYSVSTGTHGVPVEIANHDDYAALIGMVGDGTVRTLPAAGDFDHNGLYEVADIDALAVHIQEVAQGDAVNLSFDINGDGLVNPADAERWLSNAGAALNPSGEPFLPSDGNLDGVVDGSDFILWNSHKWTPLPGFSRGDWNYDGFVDGLDFLIWNNHKFATSDIGAVPEAVNLPLGGLLLAWLASRRRRR